MAQRNQLFFIIVAVVALDGCSTLQDHDAAARAQGTPPVATRDPAPAPASARPAPRANDSDMLFHALMATGIDYRRGGKSYQSGFDCSGLVAHIYRQAYGLALPHGTKAQSELGSSVHRTELRPGDLVFFNTQKQPFSHVGIYIGEGRFIHAPKEGAVVRTESLAARYWSERFDGARRIVPLVLAADHPESSLTPRVNQP